MAMGRIARLMAAVFAAGLIYTPAAAQQIFVYPTKGQSPEQQNRDRYECHTWAVQQTGFDPMNVQVAQAPATAAPPPAQEAPQGGCCAVPPVAQRLGLLVAQSREMPARARRLVRQQGR